MSFTDNYGQPPAAPSQDNSQPDYAGAWKSWITNPENRASMMQMGIALMQPIGLGQTPIGHFGQALGQGGEAADRVREQGNRDELSEARVRLNESRTENLETRAGAAAANIGLQQENLELKKLLGIFDRSAKMQEQYQKAKLLEPSLTPEQFVRQNRQFAILEGQSMGNTSAAGPQQGQFKPGDVYKGYRYKGGPLDKQASWEKV